MRCHLIPYTAKEASAWMEDDAKRLLLLSQQEGASLAVHHFSSPSITYGYFRDPEKLLNLQEIERRKIALARRPTGGGALFHFGDLSFSLVIPASHPKVSQKPEENYRWINQLLIKGFKKLGIDLALYEGLATTDATYPFCAANPTIYDLYQGEKKVGGSAERRTKWGLLHQGSIFLAPLEKEAIYPLLLDRSIAHTMCHNSGWLAVKREEVIDLLADLFQAQL